MTPNVPELSISSVADATARPSSAALSRVPQPPDYEQYLTVVDGAVRRVVRRHRLSASDAEELRSETWLKLLANHARIVGRYRGKARLETYLTVIVRNLLLDNRDKEFGKWRPSSVARRLGRKAIDLDRLLNRDHLPLDVVHELTGSTASESDAEVLMKIRGAATKRRPRCRFIPCEAVDTVAAPDPSPYDLARSFERHRQQRQVATALMRALATLTSAERHLVLSRYVAGQRLARQGQKSKRVYRQFAHILKRLRQSLEQQGIKHATVVSTLNDWPSAPFELRSIVSFPWSQSPGT